MADFKFKVHLKVFQGCSVVLTIMSVVLIKIVQVNKCVTGMRKTMELTRKECSLTRIFCTMIVIKGYVESVWMRWTESSCLKLKSVYNTTRTSNTMDTIWYDTRCKDHAVASCMLSCPPTFRSRTFKHSARYRLKHFGHSTVCMKLIMIPWAFLLTVSFCSKIWITSGQL